MNFLYSLIENILFLIGCAYFVAGSYPDGSVDSVDLDMEPRSDYILVSNDNDQEIEVKL